MANPIRNFLTAPIYEGDPEKTQDAGTTHRVGIALLGLAVVKVKLTNKEIREVLNVETPEFPRYVTQLLNLANRMHKAQGRKLSAK